jgi:hypothetical protein
MKKFILFYCLLMVAETGFSQMKDTIFFNNGSIVIGKIKKIKLGIVTFDPDDANDITVQLRNLKTIAAEREVFRVETTDGNVYYGKLIPHPSNGFVKFANGIDTSTILVQEISVMYPYGEAFLQRFTGDVGLGYNYTRSSNFGRLNYDGTLNYASSKVEISLSFSGIYTFTDSAFSRDNENFAIKNNFYFTPSWFGTVFFNYQRNLELGLQRRYQEGLGVGNKLITSKHVYTWARGGFVFNQEKSTEDVTNGTVTELFGQLEFNFFRFTKPKVDMLLAQTVYYSLSQNRFRNDGTTKVNWELVKNFKLSLEFYNNYDSKPLAEGSKFDYGILFGFSYFFY